MQALYHSSFIHFSIGFFICCGKLYGGWQQSHHYICFLDEHSWASNVEKVSVESWNAHFCLRYCLAWLSQESLSRRCWFLGQVSSQHFREMLLDSWFRILFALLTKWWGREQRPLNCPEKGRKNVVSKPRNSSQEWKPFHLLLPKATNTVMEFACRQRGQTLETVDEKRVSFSVFTEASQEPDSELEPGLGS